MRETHACISFLNHYLAENKGLEPNSLSLTGSETGTSTSFKSYRGGTDRRLGDHRLAEGHESTLLILEQKLIDSYLA